MLPKPPPPRMRIALVPDYVELRTGHKPTLQTVYNWINHGVRGDKLAIIWTRRKPGSVFPDMRLTTAAKIDDFLARLTAKVGT